MQATQSAEQDTGIGNNGPVADALEQFGLFALFAIIALQACGIPGPPGKTALVAAAIFAADGRLEIWEVVLVAALAAALGGYAGYLIGRAGGRRLLERPLVQARLARPLGIAEEFFAQHGGKAVFLARFLPGLKVVAAPAAGIARMRWPAFALWHTAAAIVFAVGFGLAAYYAGEGLIAVLERFGFYGLGLVALIVLALCAVLDQLRRRGRLPGFLRKLPLPRLRAYES